VYSFRLKVSVEARYSPKVLRCGKSNQAGLGNGGAWTVELDESAPEAGRTSAFCTSTRIEPGSDLFQDAHTVLVLGRAATQAPSRVLWPMLSIKSAGGTRLADIPDSYFVDVRSFPESSQVFPVAFFPMKATILDGRSDAEAGAVDTGCRADPSVCLVYNLPPLIKLLLQFVGGSHRRCKSLSNL
jgi:hypothetical protein